ncbi:MAG: efflux RND transporter permease subunit [Candidatus Thiodiazotropha sp. (ex Lucinoma annulata)]|nr:efflux RND transporter permease subunit [Candidatus Thiodiazotropha sp. (ex Lucinoma annulata)]
MNLASFAIDKRLISALATILILVAGYFAYQALPRFEDPEFIIRQVQIITPYSGASAKEVSEEVTDVVENALQQLSGVKQIKSKSFSGKSEVMIEFEISSTKTRPVLNQRFTQLRAKISDIQQRLPPNAGPIQVYDDFGDVFAQYYVITGEGYSLPQLHTYAKSLQKELVLVPGVSKVNLAGVPEQVIYVEYSPSRLVQLGLTSQQIAELIKGQNLVTPAGSVVMGSQRLKVRPAVLIDSLAALENLVIPSADGSSSFRLSDIASIREGLKEPAGTRLFRDGQPAIGIGISNSIGGNVVTMGDAVRARIDSLESERPIGIELQFVSDQSASVRASVDDFVGNVVLALIIVVGTLLIFMGLRSGLLMGGILLVTVAGTLFGMYLYGLDMQRISLGGLIIALGMLVDNAIVVVEGTLVRVQKGEDPARAAISVVGRTKWPLLGGTIVGLLAFSPVGFSPDNTGEYAGSLFWTVGIALLFSWLVAIWLTPYFCTLLLKPGPSNQTAGNNEHTFLQLYRRLLRDAIKVRWVTLSVVIALFASAVISFTYVPQGFFPASTRAQFVIDYTLPEGTDVAQTTKDISKIGQWVRTLDGVTSTNAVIGGGHLRFMLTYASESANPSYGQLLVDVQDHRQIEPLLSVIQDHIDSHYPDSLAKVWKFVLGPGGGSLIETRFTGSDSTVLRELSNQTKTLLADAGAISVKDDWGDQVKVVQPRINKENARRLGLSQGDISQAIAGLYDGTSIGVFREANELRQILFRPNIEFRDDVENLRDVQIFSPTSGQYVPITQVVDDFDIIFANPRLIRIDRSLAITAQADPPPGINAVDLFDKVRADIEAIELPEGYSMEWRGQYGDSQEANAGLASTMPIGFGAMIVVVFLLFNAVRQPIIIWLTVPLALIGVVYGLIAMQTPLEFVAILAVLSLTGMLVKNAIVLIDETDNQIDEGKARMSAIIDAAVSRVRPVSLGVLTTVLGVVPLLWDPFFKSLAVVIIAGLSFATVLTLIIVPTLYAVFYQIQSDELS